LPLAGFGQRTAQTLLGVAGQVRARRDPWQALYPLALQVQPVDLDLGGIHLSGALEGLLSQTGQPQDACLQLVARPGAVLQGKKGATRARGHVLVGTWVRHLAGNACGLRLTSVLVGVDGQARLPPMPPGAAHAILVRLALAYTQAWAAPLPVACKTAWAYLQMQAANAQLPPDKSPKDPHEAARAAFAGGTFGGEWDQSAYLQRAFASYDDVAEGLAHWAQELYGDLAAWADVTPDATGGQP
jgi:exodeoxyribonuclease V gamma subunit